MVTATERPSDPVQYVVNALADHDLHPRKQGKTYKAKCPTHEDVKASLTVDAGDRGALIHCHAGCDTKTILDALGLKASELFYDAKRAPAQDKTVGEYLYVNAEGELLFRVERQVGKKFVQSRPNPNKRAKEKWLYQLGDVERVPYKLPEVIAARDDGRAVFIVEGEKDVHTLMAHGLTATCNAGGAGKWMPAFSQYLADAHVVILPDNDKPGRDHADNVAEMLLKGARSIKIVNLPGIADKGDVTDWFNNAGTVTELWQVVNKAPVLPGSVPHTFTAGELMREQFADVTMAVPGIIAEGLTFLVGAPKIGKSWLSLGLGMAVAEGGMALGTIPVAEGDVLYLALEDTPRRLQHRLAVMNGMVTPESNKRFYFACNWPRFPEGLEKLDLWLQRHPDARMVIIDTFAKVRESANAEGSMYQADYQAVSEIKHLADRYACAIVLVHHQRKADDKDPLNTVAGSTGLTGAADAAVILSRPRGNEEGTLYVTGRDVEETKSVVSFDGETGRWTWLGEAAEVEENKTQDLVIQYLKAQDGTPCGPKEVADALDMKEGTCKWLLSKMAQEGQIGKIGRGKYVSKDAAANGAATQTPGLVVLGTGAAGTAQPALPADESEQTEELTDEDIEQLLAGDGDDTDWGGDDE